MEKDRDIERKREKKGEEVRHRERGRGEKGIEMAERQ